MFYKQINIRVGNRTIDIGKFDIWERIQIPVYQKMLINAIDIHSEKITVWLKKCELIDHAWKGIVLLKRESEPEKNYFYNIFIDLSKRNLLDENGKLKLDVIRPVSYKDSEKFYKEFNKNLKKEV